MTTPVPPIGGHPNFSAPPPAPSHPGYQPGYPGAQPPYPGGAPVGEPKRPAGLAVAALVVGIVAFLTGLLPVVGFVLGAIAIVLGIIALRRRQSKGLSVTGLILGGVAFLVSVGMTIAFAAFVSNQSSTESAPAPSQQSALEPSTEAQDEPVEEVEEEPEEEPAPPVEATPDLSTFPEIDDRTFALIAKDPDAHVGENFILYGSIWQLDAATGRCAMLVDAAASQQEMSYDYSQSFMAASGDWEQVCPVFDPLVEDDHVKLWATVLQSYSYDTQIGGNTTVPMIEVWQAELLPATEY